MDDQEKVNGEPALIHMGGGFKFKKDGSKKTVAVIGAGPAGLAAVRRIAESGMDVKCFEQGPTLGGIWNYSDATGMDETGMPTHYFIYKDLRTNLPKEVMAFPDYPYHDLKESYIHSTEVLKYLTNFANEHHLEEYIEYNHRVKVVKPLVDRWSLTAVDLSTPSRDEKTYDFDAVFVCSGPNSTPVYAYNIGMAKFSGQQIHSKDYRIPNTYEGKTILLIGLGPSGLDIAYQLQPVAKKMFLSSNRGSISIALPDNVELKPVVSRIEGNTVYFEDDSEELVDCIIHCTGYTYNYPFLDPSCGVNVAKYVYPLYKHFISIERPTLYVIGLVRPVNHLFMCDYQVLTAVKYLLNKIEIPSKEDMTMDLEEDIKRRFEAGEKKNNYHQLNIKRNYRTYFEELTTLGQLDPIPPVQLKLYEYAFLKSLRDFANFRNYAYRIINDEEYEILDLTDSQN